jgi:prepilin-type N-terminal cleavage/methylation domain-containing protein
MTKARSSLGFTLAEMLVAIALMALSPVSWPTGFAPAALTLKPLYCAGLGLAVVCTAPAAFSAFTA